MAEKYPVPIALLPEIVARRLCGNGRLPQKVLSSLLKDAIAVFDLPSAPPLPSPVILSLDPRTNSAAFLKDMLVVANESLPSGALHIVGGLGEKAKILGALKSSRPTPSLLGRLMPALHR